MASPTREETSGESAATTILENGLKLRKLEDGTLRFEYEASGALFWWTMDTAGSMRVVSGSANMPLALHWSLLRDARQSTLEEALIAHVKRIKTYSQRRFQVDSCAQWLGDGKIETAGACNYVQVDLNVVAQGERGRLRLTLLYDDFSMHPVRAAFSVSGSAAFKEAVTEKWEDVNMLLMSQPLNEVCRILCK